MKRNRRDARQAALDIVRTLRDAGSVALFAGGCVRDLLLDRTPKDFDVVTDALPDEVQRAFPRSKAVGKQFGVILVRKFGHDVEVATFRTEGDYSDGRRPDHVEFTNDIEDARRRDFTVNGMFYDPVDERIIDYVGGRADLDARLIRTIGDPDQRFAEDHLRMLRAVRFASELDFAVDPPTLKAIRENAEKLTRISAERVWMELQRIITHPSRARGWELLRTSALDGHLVQGWNWSAAESGAITARVTALPPKVISPTLALAALLCHTPAPQAQRFGRSLRLSNDGIRQMVWLVAQLPRARAEASLELADIKTYAAHPGCDDLLALLKADLCADEGDDSVIHERVMARIRAIDPAAAAPPPLLTGDDLLAAGFASGPQFGPVLRAVYRAQLNEEIATRDDAMAMARGLMGR